MHVCVGGNQIAADWFLEGMALKDKAQGHQALWALTSQRGSRITALPLRPSGPNILWRLVVIKIGYFNFFYYKVLFSSWTNIILKIFICFGRLCLLYKFSQQFSNLIVTFLHLYKEDIYSFSICTYLRFCVLENDAYVHFWYLLRNGGCSTDAISWPLHTHFTLQFTLAWEERVTYLTGNVRKNKLSMHSPAFFFLVLGVRSLQEANFLLLCWWALLAWLMTSMSVMGDRV